jgi:hypothetical protein
MRDDITFKKIIESCLTTALGREENGRTEKAMIGRRRSGKRQGQRSNASGNTKPSGSNTGTTRTKCSHCDKTGHNAEQCWKKYPEKKADWMKEREESNERSKSKKRKLQVSSD